MFTLFVTDSRIKYVPTSFIRILQKSVGHLRYIDRCGIAFGIKLRETSFLVYVFANILKKLNDYSSQLNNILVRYRPKNDHHL